METIQSSKPDIIIVDDNLNFRQGLIFLITIDNVANVIGKASNEKEFMKMLSHQEPDVVLIDISMLLKNEMEIAIRTFEMRPELKIIAFTMFGDEEYYFKLSNLGVKGFLLKSGGINELEKAIENVMKGETYVSDQLFKKIIINFIRSNPGNIIERAELEPAEKQIIDLTYQGMTNDAIAQSLFITSNEVKNYKSSLLRKISTQYSLQDIFKESGLMLG
ncbi:MAG: response regulator transcription factor [Methylococcaceae bacterium]